MSILIQRTAVAGALTLLAATPVQAQKPLQPLRVTLGVLPGLQYDQPRLAAKPGQRIELRFHNRDEMAHNLLIVRPGSRERVVQAALALGERGPELDYVPQTEDVLHATSVLNPGESQTLKFDAPTQKGVYSYVCSFPGHGLVMFGALYIGTPMPDALKDDQNVSPLWREGAIGATPESKAFHAWSPFRRPLMYRIFMPKASPAAIAIALPNNLSLCWDAARCRMRYAWHGGFLDPWPVWRGNGNGLAKLQGETFASEDARPYSIPGIAADVEPSFEGYRRQDGFPEFYFRLGGVRVAEKISVSEDGRGVVRTFRMEGVTEPITLAPADGKGRKLVKPKGGVAEFSITVRHSGAAPQKKPEGHKHGGHH